MKNSYSHVQGPSFIPLPHNWIWNCDILWEKEPLLAQPDDSCAGANLQSALVQDQSSVAPSSQFCWCCSSSTNSLKHGNDGTLTDRSCPSIRKHKMALFVTLLTNESCSATCSKTAGILQRLFSLLLLQLAAKSPVELLSGFKYILLP